MSILFTRKHSSSESGIAMLFAVLVSSVLLAIALSIGNISLKELIISNTIRESQAAFYAADSGMELALYADLVAPTTPPITNFTLNLTGDNNGPCANVIITRDTNPTLNKVTIDSRGYNICNENNQRRVERGLRVTYQKD